MTTYNDVDEVKSAIIIGETYLESPVGAISSHAYRACIEILLKACQSLKDTIAGQLNQFSGHTFVPDAEYLFMLKLIEEKTGTPFRITWERHLMSQRGVRFDVEDRARDLYNKDRSNILVWSEVPQEIKKIYFDHILEKDKQDGR